MRTPQQATRDSPDSAGRRTARRRTVTSAFAALAAFVAIVTLCSRREDVVLICNCGSKQTTSTWVLAVPRIGSNAALEQMGALWRWDVVTWRSKLQQSPLFGDFGLPAGVHQWSVLSSTDTTIFVVARSTGRGRSSGFANKYNGLPAFQRLVVDRLPETLPAPHSFATAICRVTAKDLLQHAVDEGGATTDGERRPSLGAALEFMQACLSSYDALSDAADR